MKNQPNGPCLNCSQHKDLTNFLKVEFVLVEDNYDLIEESNYSKQLELNKNLFGIGKGSLKNYCCFWDCET